MSKEYTINENVQKYYRIILSILLIELFIYFLSGIQTASFLGNSYVGFEQDPLLWIIYYFKIPQFILAYPTISYCIDVAIFLFLVYLIIKPFNNIIAILLFLCLFVFYAVFIGHLSHRNYQCGYLFVLIPYMFKKQLNRKILFECIRYFLLFFYCSAAYYKIKSGSLFQLGHMSEMISGQFAPYFLENNLSWRTDFNLFLISHKQFAAILYWGAFLAEIFTLIAFFTKKYDKYIAIGLLLFHLLNWAIMDIAPFGQIAFLSILFFSKKISWINQNPL